MNPKIKTDYLRKVFDPKKYSWTLKEAQIALRSFSKRHPFDAIAFTGVSGASLAFPLSLTLNKPLICIRKDDNSHYFRDHFEVKDLQVALGRVEGCINPQNYIIVDDCVHHGWTLKRIVEQVGKVAPNAKLVGIYLFADPRRRNNKTIQILGWGKVPLISHPPQYFIGQRRCFGTI